MRGSRGTARPGGSTAIEDGHEHSFNKIQEVNKRRVGIQYCGGIRGTPESERWWFGGRSEGEGLS